MERGLYTAASAMMAQQTIEDILAQNIANASTIGYKQDVPSFEALRGMQLDRITNGNQTSVGTLGTGVEPGQIFTDWSTGAIETTHNPLDVSLAAGQFLSVQTPTGTAYTRAGALTLDGKGNLVTIGGQPILDSVGKPINVSGGVGVHIDSAGNIISGGKVAATLGIMQINPTGLTKAGYSLFTALPGTAVKAATTPTVYPGTVEQSNVNIAQSLIEMIMVQRNFDTAEKAVSTHDAALQQVTTDVGKV